MLYLGYVGVLLDINNEGFCWVEVPWNRSLVSGDR